MSETCPAPAMNRGLAVVVTYEPDHILFEHLQALRCQVDAVVVVDNGSTNFATVESVATLADCRLVRNETNEGIAKALNQAVAIARDEGFLWLATFDQDSLVSPGLIQGLLDVYALHPLKHQIGVVVAAHRDRATGRDYYDPRDILADSSTTRLLRTTITSGSLVLVSAIDRAGLFDESLFIDFVDHDFCMRIRKHGFLIVEAKSSILTHSLGRTTEHRLLGRYVTCSNHSARRRYYMTRNQLEVYRRYAAFEPGWSWRGISYLLIGSILALIFEENRRAKLKAMLKGAVHFALRRFGPLTPI